MKQLFLTLAITIIAFINSTPLQAEAIESVQVPGNGDEVTFKTSFDQGQLFLLKASGAVNLGQDTLDAEYESDGGNSLDVVNGIDVGIDIGLKALRPPTGILPGA